LQNNKKEIEMKNFGIDEQFLKDMKETEHGYSTSDGIRMLRLPDIWESNFAGNRYIELLGIVRMLLAEIEGT
jgi:hypothetical protein